MIVSFHPCFEADLNRLCAGRPPNRQDRKAIQAARAVILPQGCDEALHRLARAHCPNVFPNWNARFDYPGKVGQIRLFRKTAVAHPRSYLFKNSAEYDTCNRYQPIQAVEPYPYVFKFNYGGEGASVFLVQSEAELDSMLQLGLQQEQNGWPGFLIQRYIPSGHRCLRVCVIGRRFTAYWRVQKNKKRFVASLSQGGAIDAVSDPHLRQEAIRATQAFCRQTGINLAGFDFIFHTRAKNPKPLFLEINYFFGRKGLGGSQAFYQILEKEIRAWIKRLPESK